MTPVQFDGCVGWLHEGNRTHGIVICEPLGHEALWLHKLVRSLAEHLSDRGFPVLRFHYPASGDSLGDESDPDRFGKMLGSVQSAVQALRERVTVDHLTLVGVRAGAAVALLAADGIPGLTRFIALAPVVRGRGYLRELSVVAQHWLDNAPPTVRCAVRDEKPLNILGHLYPDDLVEALRRIDLRQIAGQLGTLPARALLVDAPYGDSATLSDALQARGVEVKVHACTDWADAMREPLWSRLPEALLDTVADWLDDDPDPIVRACAQCTDAGVVLKGKESIERIVRVGPQQMVGVLCEPAEGIMRAAAPTLLITNTAANPRIADGRLAVRLARSLAAQGICSLRIDASGIGDSGARARDNQQDIPYSDQVITDMVSAADWLKEHGHYKVVSFGICSGAYTSLHAASNGQFAGAIAVNLQVFVWPRGETLTNVIKNQTNSMRGYLASLRSAGKWRRLLRSGRDLRPVLRGLSRFLVDFMSVPIMRIAERVGRYPGKDTPRGLLRDMSARGIRTHLVYGMLDPGVDTLVRHFGPASRAFAHLPNISVDLQESVDHSLHGTAAAQYVIDRCTALLACWRAPVELAVPEKTKHATVSHSRKRHTESTL
ncbi:serine aminopeptidase domain-containing protein [Burkholderia cepacia]|uniref:Alpha/beta hydrolase n=1 Tax=Burkholderia cepacia TaxID=292 RepID=A0A8I1AWS8_BURCE|nr:alpha/beta hydrolase [Burkholderia cepacia]MBA9901830.1 alpha/beta hydrolase [Burkholderia cepacia]MBA9943913.1 alpha/beta hydrolase [Burkholderia cepacia]MBA9974533.1 alpha/beta hydrolase [Burkholderia cepacia]MBA9994702.1 alpha/beta hydrolase [Burkholderia cepacia]MBB0001102.1 alpha/beta hydrolase [Burkholderia cepacia]